MEQRQIQMHPEYFRGKSYSTEFMVKIKNLRNKDFQVVQIACWNLFLTFCLRLKKISVLSFHNPTAMTRIFMKKKKRN